MRRLIIVCLVLILFAGCGKSSDGNGSDTSICGGASKGCITGEAVDANTGTGVDAAALSIDGVEITAANAQGWFFADNIEAGEGVSICFSAADYVDVCRSANVVAAQNLSLTATEMIPEKNQTYEDVDINSGTIKDDSTGAQLAYGAGDLCLASDRTTEIVGDVACAITALDVTGNAIELAPGDFSAESGGVAGLVQTAAMINIECEQDGVEVDLCTGKMSNTRFPIFGTQADCGDVNVNPASVSTWRFNTSTGMWDVYSTATKSCGPNVVDRLYFGVVDRFGWWNAGVWYNTHCLKGTVKSELGAILGGAEIVCRGIDYQGMSRGYSGTNGAFCVATKPSSQYMCIAGKGAFESDAKTGTSLDGVQSCEGSADSCRAIGQFELVDPLLRTILTWGAEPPDLDSHTVSGSLQVYFGFKDAADSATKGSLTMEPFVELDTDDTDGYGPEITTVVPGATAGSYFFCVHNFSGQEAGKIEESGAIVHATATNIVRLFEVPTSNPNDYSVWRVYQLDIADDFTLTLTDINEFADGSTSVPDACGGL